MALSEQLKQAIENYQNGMASDVEMRLIDDFYSSFDGDVAEVNAAEVGNRFTLEQKSWEEISRRSGLQMPVARVKKVPVYKTIAIAASVLLAAAGIYLWSTSEPATPPVTVVKNVDRAPGGNKAVLILADGSKIELDSAHTGGVVQQGNIKVIKLDNGRLAYQPVSGNDKGDQAVLFNTIQTPRGGQYQVVLSDGSRVWLNAASSMKFPPVFTGAERKIEITGEVYIEVAKNAGKPFIAVIDGVKVQVLGTSFNLNGYKDESGVKTTLVDGSIKVSTGKQDILLHPGEQVVELNQELSAGSKVDVEQVLAWKNGLFQFSDADFKTVIRQVERWYDIEVKFDGEVPDIQFNGKMDRGVKLSGFIRFLSDYGMKASLNGRVLTIAK